MCLGVLTKSKAKHTERKPDSWFQLLEQNIRRYFKENIWYKEYDECVVVLVVVFHLELFGKTKDIGIGNVDASEHLIIAIARNMEVRTDRSRKANRYMIQRNGITWKSILVTSRLSVVCGGHSTKSGVSATP